MDECGAVFVAARLNGCSMELALVASGSSLMPAGGSETPNERLSSCAHCTLIDLCKMLPWKMLT